MRQVRLERFGLDGLQVSTLPELEPGPGQVRVRWHHASLNYHDLAAVLGMANARMPLPQVPLSDGAGEIDALGEGVSRWSQGDRVTSRFFPQWEAGAPSLPVLRQVTGETITGVAAQYTLVDQAALLAAPATLSSEEAACLPCAALTAWRAVVEEGRVQPGQRVLVQGSGGVSLFAARFARMLGAEVFAISSSASRLALLEQQGAQHGINYRDTPEWGKAVRKLTGGQGVDLVVEVGGAGTLSQSLEAVAVGGHVSMIGVLTGLAAPVSTARIMAMNVTVKGITVGSAVQQRAMYRALDLHGIRPHIGARFPLESLGEALGLMQRSGHTGKITISLDD